MVGVTDHEQCARHVEPQRHPPIVVPAMFLIELREGVWVKKDGRSTLEGYPMLLNILSSFCGIPFEAILE